MHMGGFQRWYANLDKNGLQKFIFPINLAIFYAASEFVTYVISLVETLLRLELISAQLKSFRFI